MSKCIDLPARCVVRLPARSTLAVWNIHSICSADRHRGRLRGPFLTLNGIMAMLTSGYSIIWFKWKWKTFFFYMQKSPCLVLMAGFRAWKLSHCRRLPNLFSSFLLPVIMITGQPRLNQCFSQGFSAVCNLANLQESWNTKQLWKLCEGFNVRWLIMKMVLCNSIDGTNCAWGRGFDSSAYQVGHCFITGKCCNSPFLCFFMHHLDLRGPLEVKICYMYFYDIFKDLVGT